MTDQQLLGTSMFGCILVAQSRLAAVRKIMGLSGPYIRDLRRPFTYLVDINDWSVKALVLDNRAIH